MPASWPTSDRAGRTVIRGTLDLKREDIYGCVRILKSQLKVSFQGKLPSQKKSKKNKTKQKLLETRVELLWNWILYE